MTIIADIPEFKNVHKKASTYKACPPDVVQKYRGVLPDLLTDTWQAAGFQSFSNGFLWSVNPDEYRAVISDFLYDFQIEDVHVAFRTAFGDMILWFQGQFYHFSAVTLRHGAMTGTLELILEMYLGRRRSLNDIFFFDLFRKAYKRLGPPTEEEVYGFFPAVPLGGEIAAENLQKVNLRAHLAFLSELVRPA